MDTPAHHATASCISDPADRRLIERELRQVVKDEGLALRYRPVFDRRDGRRIAVDAVIEWHHPTLGMIPPEVFLPIAEATGLIIPIGEWMLWEAALTAKARDAVNDHAVNDHAVDPHCVVTWLEISTQQLAAPTFLATLADIVDTTGIDPGLLAVSLTGEVDLDDCERIESTVVALRVLGLGVVFDTEVARRQNGQRPHPEGWSRRNEGRRDQ